MSVAVRFGLLLLTVLLSACAHRATRSDAAPAWRSSAVIPSSWVLEGRLAVSDGKESGSGRIHWEQNGDAYTITLRAPVSGQSWRLSGDRAHAQLEGVRPDPVRGSSARELLRRELGWELPVGEMTAWIFGIDLAGEVVERTPQGAPLRVSDSGWQLEYRDWQSFSEVAVPRRITARRAPYQVRLAIQRWSPAAEHADAP